jgi:hypothetical protein
LIERILETKPKHFVAIQYPFNLFERNAIDPGYDGSPSVVELCHDHQLYQMTQRSLNAITNHLYNEFEKFNKTLNTNYVYSSVEILF